MSPIVHADNLSRFYGMILGLNNVSFTIRAGITGLVGPNGAGKTTLFRLLLGQIRPSAGELFVFGERPWKNQVVQAQLAYCPESEVIPAGLRPLEWLVGLGMISGLSATEADARSRTALGRVKLAPEHWKKRVSTFSKGMKQRVKLAQCLLHNPQLVILDEPMNGLDPIGREDIADVLRQLASEGVSVIISSHLLSDLETLCNDFILLRWGRIPRSLNEATSAEVRNRWPEATTFRCEAPDKLARFLFAKDLLRGCDVAPESGTLHARWREPEKFFAAYHQLLLESGVRIFEIQDTASFLEKVVEPIAES